MFEKDPRIALMVEELHAVCAPLNRGDILTHGMIRPILGCEPHEDHWQHCVRLVLRRLEEERGIAYWPERTVGYRLLTEQEQLGFLVWKRLRKGNRQTRKLRRSVAALSANSLTLHQKQIQLFTLDMLKRKEAEAREELRDHQVAIRPTPLLPQRNAIR